MGKTRRDHLKSEIIRQEMDINPMMDLLDMRQLKYPGHPSRADKERKIKQFLEVKPDGQRPEEGQE